MVLVAVVAIAMGLAGLVERRATRFRFLADSHREQIVSVLSGPFDWDGEFRGDPSTFDLQMRPVTGVRRRKDLWHMAMAREYRRASYRPWLPVPPDPLPPE